MSAGQDIVVLITRFVQAVNAKKNSESIDAVFTFYTDRFKKTDNLTDIDGMYVMSNDPTKKKNLDHRTVYALLILIKKLIEKKSLPENINQGEINGFNVDSSTFVALVGDSDVVKDTAYAYALIAMDALCVIDKTNIVNQSVEGYKSFVEPTCMTIFGFLHKDKDLAGDVEDIMNTEIAA